MNYKELLLEAETALGHYELMVITNKEPAYSEYIVERMEFGLCRYFMSSYSERYFFKWYKRMYPEHRYYCITPRDNRKNPIEMRRSTLTRISLLKTYIHHLKYMIEYKNAYTAETSIEKAMRLSQKENSDG